MLSGGSRPEQQTYSQGDGKAQLRFDKDAGPLVSHVYELRNQGPSRIQRAVLDIYWPSFTQTGQNLLYLLDDPETQVRRGDGRLRPSLRTLNLDSD